ncbi:MAG TPA: hypothetical protein VFU62_07945 [Hanamia sp.]|nr:hypothetical protein [Hanamia sp.]
MKSTLFAHILIMIILVGCGLTQNNDGVKLFIPGTYIRFSTHEFGTEYDTLIIVPLNPSAGYYSIIRRWKYLRVVDDKKMEPEYKIRTTAAIYDSKRHLLQETNTGKIYSIDVTGNCLFSGSIKYRKL